jgi:hypothetical protein
LHADTRGLPHPARPLAVAILSPLPQVPEGYSRRLLNDMIDKHTGGLLSAGPVRRRRYGDDEEEDLMFGGELDW